MLQPSDDNGFEPTIWDYMISLLRFVLGLFMVSASLGSALADQHHPTAQPHKRVTAPATAHPALWKVQSGKTTIYLFGTVHALPKGMVWLDGPLARAFDSSDELVTEIVEKKPAEMVPLLQAKAMLTNGQTLRQLLSPKHRVAFEKALKAQGMAPDALDPFKPWYAAVALSTFPLMREGYDPASGVDARLSERAAVLKHPHSALETAEFQLGLFDALPMATQKHYLHEVVLHLPSISSELGAMIGAWQAGNAPKLAALMNAENDEPSMTELLLIRRNKTWARWIRARMAKSGTVFVAVGAGHLAGKGSVQDQLRALGIRVSRVQ